MNHNYMLLGALLLTMTACSDSENNVDMEATKAYCDESGGRFVEGQGCVPSPKQYVEACKEHGMKYDAKVDGCIEK